MSKAATVGNINLWDIWPAGKSKKYTFSKSGSGYKPFIQLKKLKNKQTW